MNLYFLMVILMIFFLSFYIFMNITILLSFSIILDFELSLFSWNSFNFIFILDFYSIIFLMTVLLISLSVFLFSSSYMNMDKYYHRFHFLLLSFVISMMFLILSPNLISILLGWDGLGVSSYLLVIYYSSSKSFNSGMITVMSNRVGDALIIGCLSMLMFLNNLNLPFMSYTLNMNCFITILIILIAGCTKSAQIPFSAWLPAAMAAPTPVSSLVHSSTLVTAGIYLIFRFENLLIFLGINFLLLFLGITTMIMASLTAFFEMDMKKMVALSTLSQLGVMMTALGSGFYILSFFHLLSHAFFKALLFISAGNMIHSSESYQDLRVMGGSSEIMILSKSIVLGCSASLCGLPFMSAFYSKEMIIESLLTYNLTFFSYFFMMLGVMMTIYYSARFFTLALMWNNRQRSIFSKSDSDSLVNYSMMILLIPAVTAGSLISTKLSSSYSLLLISGYLKFITLSFFIISILIFYKIFQMKIMKFFLLIWMIITMWGMTSTSTRLPLFFFKNLGDYLNKMSDYSWMNYFYSMFFIQKMSASLMFGNLFLKLHFLRILNFMFFMIILMIFIKY